MPQAKICGNPQIQPLELSQTRLSLSINTASNSARILILSSWISIMVFSLVSAFNPLSALPAERIFKELIWSDHFSALIPTRAWH